ncbi:hypothetical protein RJ641_029802 [Dillenia turbinata]|uniref:TRAFD1/XAF1 zinc finger domain-containing protein n=1 Tax=Dillenia turbinata TaxID=194707 RepID=A0AAN8W2N2_9MAGN
MEYVLSFEKFKIVAKPLFLTDRAIPSSNIALHYAHCSRNLERCKICGDMVPKRHADEHYLNTHAPLDFVVHLPRRKILLVSSSHSLLPELVSCSLCSKTMDRESLDSHKGENCPQRIVTCEYCEFPLPAVDLFEHQEFCGNRTEYCQLCSRYIRLRERAVHETTCNGVSDTSVGSSRDIETQISNICLCCMILKLYARLDMYSKPQHLLYPNLSQPSATP